MSRTERLAPAVILIAYVAGLAAVLVPRIEETEKHGPFAPIIWAFVLTTIGTVCFLLAALSLVRRITQPVTIVAAIWVIASGLFSFRDDLPTLAWAALVTVALVALVTVRRRGVSRVL